ncbi:MAG: response regulator transcription factor [Candidatus Bathyarchaeota archaeon]|nr:response regulator transcription factor [Candidatus Bathyarchaeota archaeon]
MTKIMLVDDDVNLQKVYLTLFRMNNLEIIAQAYDGIQAVEMYKTLNTKPDAIIMDQRMPRMDGITATGKIIEIDPNAKIIFLSADDSAEGPAKKSGAKMFLSKPISIEELLSSIQLVIKNID